MPIKRELIYPFFLDCINHCTDSFWEQIFDDLAYGKAPYGTYITKGFLCCSYKNKEFSYKIERKETSLILYTDIFTLMKEKLGILSYKEAVQKKLDFTDLEKNLRNSRQEWGDIKKKTIKDSLYEKYAIDMAEKHNLTTQQTKYLLALLLLAITFKSITSKDIIYENDKIIHINGLEISQDNISLNKPLCKYIQSNAMDNVISKFMSDNWQKYIENIN